MNNSNTLKSITTEENENYLSVLFQIFEDAHEKVKTISKNKFNSTHDYDISGSVCGKVDEVDYVKVDDFTDLTKFQHTDPNKIEKRKSKLLSKLSHQIKVLEKEIAAERMRELKLLQSRRRTDAKSHKFLRKLELHVMRERCHSADKLMELLGPGSKYVDYLTAIVERSGGRRVDLVEEFEKEKETVVVVGKKKVDHLSNLPRSVRKSYQCHSRK